MKVIMTPSGLSMSTHALELGIGLGHIGLYINKILFVGCLPMYWNWVLDWVILDDTLTKCCLWVVYPILELSIVFGHIRPHVKKMFFMDVVPMYWN